MVKHPKSKSTQPTYGRRDHQTDQSHPVTCVIFKAHLMSAECLTENIHQISPCLHALPFEELPDLVASFALDLGVLQVISVWPPSLCSLHFFGLTILMLVGLHSGLLLQFGEYRCRKHVMAFSAGRHWPGRLQSLTLLKLETTALKNIRTTHGMPRLAAALALFDHWHNYPLC